MKNKSGRNSQSSGDSNVNNTSIQWDGFCVRCWEESQYEEGWQLEGPHRGTGPASVSDIQRKDRKHHIWRDSLYALSTLTLLCEDLQYSLQRQSHRSVQKYSAEVAMSGQVPTSGIQISNIPEIWRQDLYHENVWVTTLTAHCQAEGPCFKKSPRPPPRRWPACLTLNMGVTLKVSPHPFLLLQLIE